ncbi:MAG: DUF86 domain-containing protein [Symploca sp. SIO3E6]|nr:DUF86 domain-containing protein [Caldora sp. SIO3E6]
MSKLDDIIRLRHMLDATQKVLTFTQNRSREDLDRDDMLALAVVRLIEILGEAAKNISPETEAQAPEIPWRQIKGTRDRLAHAYFDVNLDVVWEIATTGLPPLANNLELLLEKIETYNPED